MVNAVYKYGKGRFEAGKYADAAEALSAYKALGTDAENVFR